MFKGGKKEYYGQSYTWFYSQQKLFQMVEEEKQKENYFSKAQLKSVWSLDILLFRKNISIADN